MNFISAILCTLATILYGASAYLAAVNNDISGFCLWIVGASIWAGLSGYTWTDVFLKR